jgi:leader peptidase (prepilin peptidase)/N-methyltransferase
MSFDAAHWVIVLFAAAFGGAVGSFLNVVVYRLPNRLSLISPPSHCPMCKEPIRWFDNVPVFGWIMLGGHCRHCHCWIPMRYPLVEALTAAMFAALALVENPLTADSPAAYPCHAMLLCTLLCSALIEVDGNRPPLRLFVPALIVGIVVPLVWPIDRVDVGAGLAAGFVAGGATWLFLWGWGRMRAENASDVAPPSTGLPLGLICAGPYVGWAALAAIAFVTLAAYALLLLPRRGEPRISIPPSVWLLLGTFTWFLADAYPLLTGRL